MKELRLALVQISPKLNLEENIQKAVKYCKLAKEENADICIFPEMFSNGYNIYNRPFSIWKEEAITADSFYVKTFQDLAKQLDLAIVITLLENHNGNIRNTAILIDRFGDKKITYAKVHTCDFSVEKNLTPGDDFYVEKINTSCGDVNVGLMICYDREFPEAARILMLKGAELILVPNACPMEINRLSQLRGRAYENMVAIATCNYPINVPDCNGKSSVYDGVAYLEELEGSRDTCILEADEEEGLYIASLDLDMIRNYRKKEVHGNAYRHPDKYGILTSNQIAEPFIRKDYRK